MALIMLLLIIGYSLKWGWFGEKIFPKPWSDKVNTWKESTYNEICAVTQFIDEKAMGTWNS